MMPAIRRTIIEPLHACWSGSSKLANWRGLEQSQYLAEARLRDMQWRRLMKMLRFAWENNEFHRNRMQLAGVKPAALRSAGEVSRLPILTKAEIRRSGTAMLSRGFHAGQLQHATTGGSTGKALDLYFTEECSELRNACARRHDRWSGWEPGEPIAACWGNPHLPKTLGERLKQWLVQPVIYLDTMQVSEASVLAFVNEWRRMKPTLLFGHAHSLYVLAQYLRELGIDSLRPRGILSTSMMLIPSERKVIEKVFGVGVIDRYGCEEVGLIACECEKHEGLHLNIEHLFIEFLKDDNTPATPGEPGRIVVTDLMNLAMPLIRYEVEDVGIPSEKKCSCGRGLPLMESVSGRVADFLVRRDGSKVAGISLIENTLTRFPGLDQMQIVQHNLKLFDIRVVRGQGLNDAVLSALQEYFASQFGGDAIFNFTFVEAIAPEASGKYRFSICKF